MVEKSKDDGFDSILTTLGFGKWTVLMFSTYVLWGILLPYFSLGGAFYNPSIEHWCNVPELANTSWTTEQKLNYSIPWEDKGGQLKRSRCYMYERNYSAVKDLEWTPDLHVSLTEGQPALRPCQHAFNTTIFTNTIAMEWDLVCSNAGWSPFFQSFYFFGTVFGEPLLGYLADRFGRTAVLKGSIIVFSVTALTSLGVPYYGLILGSRFILGIIHAACGIGFVKAMEACPPKYRTTAGLFLTTPFSFSGITFGIIAYYIRSWRVLQLVCTIPCAFALVLLPFMDESPRWQILKGKTKEAKKTLKKAARWHNVSLSDDEIVILMLEEQCKTKETNNEKETTFVAHDNEELKMPERRNTSLSELIIKWIKECFTLVRTPVLRRISLGMFVCWFATGATYWGMSLSGTTFSSDPFLYMILSSLVEVPAYVGFVPVVAKFGRKRVLFFNFVVCASAILGILITPKNFTWIVFILALIGKLFITSCYNILYLFSSELFPTCVRSRGLNTSSMMGRIGSVGSPFIIKILAETYWWAPSFSFGCCAVFGAIGALLLPESKGKPLSETIEQTELLYGRPPIPSKISKRKGLEEEMSHCL